MTVMRSNPLADASFRPRPSRHANVGGRGQRGSESIPEPRGARNVALALIRRLAMAQTTTNHETIRKWVDARGGRPAKVKGTGDAKDAGLLRLDFGKPEESLETISWEAFFDKFDESQLALLYEDEPGNRFNKLVSR
jgi:hypothetical protein